MSLLALGNPRPWTQAKEVWEEAPMWYLDTPQGWSWGSQALESQPLCIANHPPPHRFHPGTGSGKAGSGQDPLCSQSPWGYVALRAPCLPQLLLLLLFF